jgi:hypothetical protein
MATLEELYRYYLNQPITYVPGSTIGGLSSLTEINRNDAGGDSMGASPVTSINTDPNVTNTTPGTGIMGTNINFSDIGKALGFAMNPTLGIANLVATQVFGRSPMDMAMEAMGIGGFGRTDSDFATAGVFGGNDSSSTGTANATDTGDMGSEAANDAASASAAAGGSGGGGADSAGDGGDGYATGGRVSQGLDYLMGIERRGYQEGGESMVSPDDAMLSYDQAVEKSRQERINKNALANQKFNDYLKEKTGYGNIEDYYQDPERLAYDPRAAEGDITKAIYDAINLQGYKPYGYDDNNPFQFAFDKDPNFFYTQEYDGEGRLIKRTPLSSEEKQKQIKNYLENALYDQSLLDPNRFGFSKDKPTTIEGSKFFLDQLKNLQKRDPDFEKVIKEGKYIDALENKLRNLYDPGEYQKLQETLDPGYSKYAQDNRKINKAFDTSDVLANYGYKDGQLQPIDSSIYGYLSEGERDIIEQSQSLPTYLTGYAQQLIQDARNRKQADQDRREQMLSQADQYASKQMVSPDDAMNQYDILNQMDEVTGVGSGALTAGSLLPKYIDDFQYAAPPGTDIDQVRNLARQTASDKSITALIKDVYNDPAKFDPNFKPKAGQIKTGYPQYLKEGILSATGFQPTSQIGGGTDAARAFLEKIKSVPGAQFLGKVLPGVGTASGVYDVGSRLSQGDYVGAGLGALSAIPFVGIPAAAAQAAYDYRGPLIEKATNFFNKLQSAPSNVTEHINTAVGSLNPFQQQQYVNYAIQNPDQAITAAQQNKDFLAATQKNIAPAPASMATGGRVFYLQGGLASLLR